MHEDMCVLFKIPCGVAKRLERLKRNILWEWFDDVNGSQLVKSVTVTLAKRKGGWVVGVRNW